MYRRFGKRAFDLAAAMAGVILLSPLLLGVAILVRLLLGSPVLFRQERLGLNSQAFRMIKFRSMTDERDASGSLLSDEQRLSPFGRFLRATSLDELPELVNVLRGEMSLVGPRPLYTRYRDRYTPEQARRHAAPPGITGWAQVNGRNEVAWDRRFALDVWYVDHCSFTLDIKILAMTAWKVFKREGISRPGHATMPEFLGNVGHRDVQGIELDSKS